MFKEISFYLQKNPVNPQIFVKIIYFLKCTETFRKLELLLSSVFCNILWKPKKLKKKNFFSTLPPFLTHLNNGFQHQKMTTSTSPPLPITIKIRLGEIGQLD